MRRAEPGMEVRAYQAAFVLASEATAFVGPDDALRAVNPAFRRLLGPAAQEGVRLADAFPPGDAGRIAAFLQEARRWSEASLLGPRTAGPPAHAVDLWANQFVAETGERLVLVRARSAESRLEAERLHEAAVLAARAGNAATTWQELAEGAEGVVRAVLPRLDGLAWMRRREGRWTVARSVGSLAPAWPVGTTFAAASPWARFARQGEAVLVAHVGLELRAEDPALAAAVPHASLLLAPIAARGEPQGLLVAVAPGEASFSLEDLRCVEAVAREVASAAARLTDHEALAASHEKLAAALDAQQALLGRVRRLHAELEEFALWTTHDLREPLRGLATLADMLAAEAKAADAPDVEDLAAQVAASATRLKEQIRFLHDFHERARDPGHREDVPLEDVVVAAARELEGRDVRLRGLSAGLHVVADPGRARRALADVLRYAGARVAGPLEVEVAHGEGVARLRVPVPGGGTGRAGELAFRVVGVADSLALARRIALQHGGALQFEAGGGALLLTLPTAGPAGGPGVQAADAP
ncbi:MAG TPA: GAF domain-containing protein [Candidatus Thermoplasmatota archaeon]|nr:GAF domain-containing protein [Candidatus Thermoplasmatota archaeon]